MVMFHWLQKTLQDMRLVAGLIRWLLVVGVLLMMAAGAAIADCFKLILGAASGPCLSTPGMSSPPTSFTERLAIKGPRVTHLAKPRHWQRIATRHTWSTLHGLKQTRTTEIMRPLKYRRNMIGPHSNHADCVLILIDKMDKCALIVYCRMCASGVLQLSLQRLSSIPFRRPSGKPCPKAFLEAIWNASRRPWPREAQLTQGPTLLEASPMNEIRNCPHNILFPGNVQIAKTKTGLTRHTHGGVNWT